MTGSHDSYTMSISGTLKQACGEASFKIVLPNQPASSPTPTPRPAHVAEGTCSLELTQWLNFGCGAPLCDIGQGYGDSRYSVAVTIKDAKGTEVGKASRTDAGDPNSLQVKNKLEDVLVITPEKWNDYIQFSLPDEHWASHNIGGDPTGYCTLGSWKGDGSCIQTSLTSDCTLYCLPTTLGSISTQPDSTADKFGNPRA
jgi:hypothetical protein